MCTDAAWKIHRCETDVISDFTDATRKIREPPKTPTTPPSDNRFFARATPTACWWGSKIARTKTRLRQNAPERPKLIFAHNIRKRSKLTRAAGNQVWQSWRGSGRRSRVMQSTGGCVGGVSNLRRDCWRRTSRGLRQWWIFLSFPWWRTRFQR